MSRISPTVLQRNDHGPVFRSLCGVAPWRPFQDLKKRVSWVVTFVFFFFAADMFFIIICSNMYEDVEDEQTKIKDYSGMYRRLIVVGT